MIRFEELGFKSFDAYLQHFFDTLLPSNKTYEYFVDWEKVKKAVNEHLDEIYLLNSLSEVENRERGKKLAELLKKYPQVVEVIPLLIAERGRRGVIEIFDPEIEAFLEFSFAKSRVNEKTIPEIVKFCRNTGILALFDEVKVLKDYLLGVEVGLDTNARKNRSGGIFEGMVQRKVRRICHSHYRIVENDPEFSLYPLISRRIGRAKTHDVVIYSDVHPIGVIECNFYNVTGSKPISIAESYIEMHRVARERGIEFIWVTDGPAWRSMKESLLRAMEQLEWILNFRMVDLIRRIL